MKATEINVIPYPNAIVMEKGICNLSDGFILKGDIQNQDYLKEILVSELALFPNQHGIVIKLTINKKIEDDKEAYRLSVTPSEITIEAYTQSGIFYGIQTLRQLIRDKKCNCLIINDKPSFKWRAYMLDEARYFHGKEAVKKLLDEMALLKLNTFHWHLTNDAGWRIEIKKYPLLTSIGSVRDSSQINDNGNKWKSELFDSKEHKGFYTQDEIKELIDYAAKRYITIIPEISMPGHASAAVASYPWLGTDNQKIKIPVKFGVIQTVLNPVNPQVIQFLHDVLKEVSDLFPSDILHIGGDEVKYDQWKNSPEVTSYMKKQGLSTYSDVQVKFTNDMSTFISDSLGKRMMGWNEILGINVHEWSSADNAKTELSLNTIIHFWKGSPELMKLALDRGYSLVNSNHQYTYLDYTYKQINLEKSYHFNPLPDSLPAVQQKQILGLGCQMWSEWTPSDKDIEYQTYPRIAAYAETGWTTADKKNYDRFEKSLQFFFDRWNKKRYNFAPLSKAKNYYTLKIKSYFQQAFDKINEANNILILPHRKADGDALGSAYGLKTALLLFGKNAEVLREKGDEGRYNEIIKKSDDRFQPNEIEGAGKWADLIIAVDSSKIEMLRERKCLFENNINTIMFDHHTDNTLYANINILEKAGACAEVIYNFLEDQNMKINADVAHNILLGILSDTGGLKKSNAKAQSMEISAKLLNLGADRESINTALFESNRKETLLLKADVLNNLKFFKNDEIVVAALTKEQLDKFNVKEEDKYGINEEIMSLKSVKLAFRIDEKEDGVSISARSKKPYQAGAICKKFGGGGHIGAAGAGISNTTIEEAIEIVANEAELQIKEIDNANISCNPTK